MIEGGLHRRSHNISLSKSKDMSDYVTQVQMFEFDHLFESYGSKSFKVRVSFFMEPRMYVYEGNINITYCFLVLFCYPL